MPVIFQTMILRRDLVSNPGVLYLFGDNVEGRGLGGQAKEMRGERNAVGIPTKWRPGMEDADFFGPEDIAKATALIGKAFERAYEHIHAGGVVVCPADGLGTGRAQLAQRCPALFEVLRRHVYYLRRDGSRRQPETAR